MMDVQVSKEQWKNLKVELNQAWDELSAEDIERTHGSFKSIFGLVSQKCDLHEEEVKAKLTSLLKKYRQPEDESNSYYAL